MIIAQTPLRISFAGGGTDFREFFSRHSGGVVGTAIDKFVFCIVNERFDETIYVNFQERDRRFRGRAGARAGYGGAPEGRYLPGYRDPVPGGHPV